MNKEVQQMLRVEFHCHTVYSKDSLTAPADLLEACRQKGIDRVVITDHNTILGALEAKALDPERVIVGEEVMTSAGELLAAYVKEEIPAMLEPIETLRLLREQGAFISVSHPFDRMRSPWTPEMLLEMLPDLDAIETFNSRCMWPGFNWQAQRFARRNHLAGTSGSDAHTTAELGTAWMELDEFDDPASLRKVIRKSKAHNKLSGWWVHGASRDAVRIKEQAERKE
jgi:predicted metal-dependent phosphoesterase TrpH